MQDDRGVLRALTYLWVRRVTYTCSSTYLIHSLQALWWSGSLMVTLWTISKRGVDYVSCSYTREAQRKWRHTAICPQLRRDPSILCIKYAPQWQYVLSRSFYTTHTKHRPYQSKYVHEMNITHRDLKPENILLSYSAPDADPVVKIADFGLAKAIRNLTMLLVSKLCLFCPLHPNLH